MGELGGRDERGRDERVVVLTEIVQSDVGARTLRTDGQWSAGIAAGWRWNWNDKIVSRRDKRQSSSWNVAWFREHFGPFFFRKTSMHLSLTTPLNDRNQKSFFRKIKKPIIFTLYFYFKTKCALDFLKIENNKKCGKLVSFKRLLSQKLRFSIFFRVFGH